MNAPQQGRPIQANWSQEMVEQWNKRWREHWEWAQRAGVPIPLQEAALRDALAGIECMRMANNLQAYIPALRGRQQ